MVSPLLRVEGAAIAAVGNAMPIRRLATYCECAGVLADEAARQIAAATLTPGTLRNVRLRLIDVPLTVYC